MNYQKRTLQEKIQEAEAYPLLWIKNAGFIAVLAIFFLVCCNGNHSMA